MLRYRCIIGVCSGVLLAACLVAMVTALVGVCVSAEAGREAEIDGDCTVNNGEG